MLNVCCWGHTSVLVKNCCFLCIIHECEAESEDSQIKERLEHADGFVADCKCFSTSVYSLSKPKTYFYIVTFLFFTIPVIQNNNTKKIQKYNSVWVTSASDVLMVFVKKVLHEVTMSILWIFHHFLSCIYQLPVSRWCNLSHLHSVSGSHGGLPLWGKALQLKWGTHDIRGQMELTGRRRNSSDWKI